MLNATDLCGFGLGESPVAQAEFLSYKNNGANAGSYTFAAVAIGAAHPERRIILAISGYSTGAPVATVTVGGVAAVKAAEVSGRLTSVWVADVPSGTAANIVITGTAAMPNIGCGVYRSTTLIAGYRTAFTQVTNNAGASYTATLDVPLAGPGFVVGCAWTNVVSSFTWTGLAENGDTQLGGATATGTSAFANYASAGTKAATCQAATSTNASYLSVAFSNP